MAAGEGEGAPGGRSGEPPEDAVRGGAPRRRLAARGAKAAGKADGSGGGAEQGNWAYLA